MRNVPKILLHLLPLVPLLTWHLPATFAALLLVVLPYIKVFKLRADMLFLAENSNDVGSAAYEKKLAHRRGRLELWLGFTFLEWWEARRAMAKVKP